jgi:polyisoprenoid-binding protein YceI
MRNRNFLLILVLALVALTAQSAPAADSYAIDTAHSSIGFSVKHMMISNVKGTFGTFSGSISLDPENIENSLVEISIDVSSVDTRNEKRDDHLRSADFFDATNHSAITFTSDKVMKKGDGYVVSGTLVMHGVSKKVDMPFELNGPVQNPWGQTVIGIELEYKLNRKDFGLEWNKAMDNGGVVVGDEVKIEINLEATKS